MMRRKNDKKKSILFLIALLLLCISSACGKTENTDLHRTETEVSQVEELEEKNTDTKEENNAVKESDYIFPDSNEKKLTERDLKALSKEELRLARNEIYARLGRKFDDQALMDYFESKSWYHGTIEPSDFSEESLSEIEKYNTTLIAQYEKKQKNQTTTQKSSTAQNTSTSKNLNTSQNSNMSTAYENSGNGKSNLTICSACKGLGHCPYCNSGSCTYCNGTGQMTCTSCTGLGYCLACGGNGYSYSGVGIAFHKHACTTCRGSGRCRLCQGSRSIQCSTCGGSRRCKYCYGAYSCSSCLGKGYY